MDLGGVDKQALKDKLLTEVLEYLDLQEGDSLASALSPKPEAAGRGADVAALLGGDAGKGLDEAAEACPVCGKQPCECPQEG